MAMEPPTPSRPSDSPQSFRETTAARPWMRAIGVALLMAAVVTVVVVVVSGPPFFRDQTSAAVSLVVGSVLEVALGLVSIINRITLEVDTQHVTLGFWPIWKKRIPSEDIADVAPTQLNPVMFGGLGLRRIPGRRWGLLFSAGAGLVVTRRSDGAAFYIRTNHADDAIAAFRRRSAAQGD